MTDTTHHQILVERLDGDTPEPLDQGNTFYRTDWQPEQAARQINWDVRVINQYDGPLRVHVGIETFDYPAGVRAAAAEESRKRQAAHKRLRGCTKAELIRMLRAGGYIGGMYPPEKWTKEEVLSSVIDQELSRAT